MKFLPLLELRVRHPYYTDRRCPDLDIEPTAAGDKLLRDHRMVLKPLPDGVRVLAPVDVGPGDGLEPFIPFAEGTVLGLHLATRNPDFALFTDLAAHAGLAAPLYASAGGGEFVLTSRTATRGERFTVAGPAAGERFVLAGRPLAGAQVGDFQVQVIDGAGVKAVGYDPSSRTVTVDSRSASAGERFALEYPVTPERARGTLADVEIRDVHAGWLENGPARFDLTFAVKRALWVYYLVTDLEDPAGDLQIVHDDAEDADPALAFSGAELGDAPDPADAQAAELTRRYPDLRRFRFVSDGPVTCRQRSRSGLELRAGGDRLAAGLPNPSLHNFATLPAASTGSSTQPSLFHVVKHVTHSLSRTGL